MAVERIKDRVLSGGHDIPTADVKRRFNRSIGNFFKRYRILLNTWIFFNNSGMKPKLIAKKNNAHINVTDKELFEKILKKNEVKL